MIPCPGKMCHAVFVRGRATKSSVQWTWASVLTATLRLTGELLLRVGDVGSLRAFLGSTPVSLQWQMVDLSQAVWTCGGEFEGGEFSLDLPAQNRCRQSSFDVTALYVQPVSCMLQSGCHFLQQVE